MNLLWRAEVHLDPLCALFELDDILVKRLTLAIGDLRELSGVRRDAAGHGPALGDILHAGRHLQGWRGGFGWRFDVRSRG